jgi:hypothetical protein
MSRPSIHKREIYYLPSWQGGDIVIPLCQRAASGWHEFEGRNFPLSDIAITCRACLAIMAGVARPNAHKRHARAA